MSTEEFASMRDGICDAAMELVRESGMEGVSFRRIAAKLGCSYTAPYRYYGSKDEIVVALRARAFRDFGAKLDQAIDDEAAPTADRLHRLVEAYVEAATEDPDSYRLMLDLNQGNAEGDGALAEAKKAALGTCRKVIAQATDAGELPPETDANIAAHVFWSAAHGLVSLELARQMVLGCTLDDLVPVVAEVLVRGLKEPAGNSAKR